MATRPPSASRHYRRSALLAQRAAREARKAQARGPGAVAVVVAAHQATQARLSQGAVGQMLAEQDITAPAEALLSPTAFTTAPENLLRMVDATADAEFERLVESLVQDAGRAAESVASAVRPDVAHVRFLSPPSCSRCAVLAGRVYRFSDGFRRHPNCDCVMIPTTVAAAEPDDVEQLIRDGQVTGLSKADMQALRDGADVGQVVNVRRARAGLRESGRVLARRGRPTPEGIYRLAGGDRPAAVALLRQHGYIL